VNINIKASVAAAVVLMGMAPSAFAGVQLDDKSLTDVLVQKGVLTPDEAKQVAKNNDGKLELEATFYLNTTRDKYSNTTGGISTETNGLNVDRAYFTAKYHFNDDWMARITTDMGHESTLGKQQNIYLKYAYVEGKLYGDQAVLRVGQSHTPWIDLEEGLWGHRYVTHVMSDQYGFDDSADLGLGLKGKLMNGLIDYFITETNGTGYGKGNINSGNKGLDFNSRIGIRPVEGLTVDFQFRDGYRDTKTNTSAGTKSTMFQGMITYGMAKDWRVGANYILNEDKSNVAGSTAKSHIGNINSGAATYGATGGLIPATFANAGDKIKSQGYDVWAWGKFPGTNFGTFGRYEDLQNQGTIAGITQASKEKITRYALGVDYAAVKGVDFALVYDDTKMDNVGGTAGVTAKDARYGLYSQVNF
jgi:hypothetical protein